jgi:homeobox protein MSX
MDSSGETSPKMTVTPIRMVAMSSPTVTSVDSPPQTKTITSRISNFSVASLLADTRSKTPPPSRIIANHINRSIINNNNNEICLTPKNLSMSQASSCSPNSQNNDSSNSIRHHEHELLDQRSHTPHSSIASDDYDDSIQGDDDDEDVDIEDVNSENSTNGQKSSSGLLPSQSLVGGAVPIRPTPFSALAAAAAAWGGMNNGVGAWPGRQMPPFGPPGLFPGQGFPGQMNGGKNRK